MNDNTAKLLEQLAQKFGTTTEYLWKVLLKQAPISATISVIYILITLVFGLAIYLVHRKFSKEDSRGYSIYDDSDGPVFGMVAALIVFVVLFITSILQINNVINGYFNPEYWALNEILNSI